MISVDDRRPAPPCPADFNLAERVLTAGRDTPDKIAVAVLRASGAQRWSYAHLGARIGGTAAWLLDNGVHDGTRVLLRLGNTLDVPVAFLACVTIGALPIPSAAGLTAAEVAVLADAVSPDIAIVNDGIVPPPNAVPTLDASEMRTAPNAEPRFRRGDPNRPAYVAVTSGTSGTPRPVVHAHRAIWARDRMVAGWTGMTATDRVLHAGAFTWSYTLGIGLLDPWTRGATALVLDEATDPALLPLLLKRHDATIFAAVPGVFRKLLSAPLPALPKLRHALSAGEKLPESLRQKWRTATGTDIHEAFGQTEVSTFLSGNPTRPAPPSTLGYCQPGRAVAILGDDGPVERVETGEIAVSADDDGLALSAAPTGAWHRTGDLGAMDRDGAVRYLGRADDVLTAGGYRISPVEVETALSDLPVAALAIADHSLSPETRVVAAYYVADTALDEAAANALAAERLAPWKRPRVWIRLPELPRGANGKLLRRRLAGVTPVP